MNVEELTAILKKIKKNLDEEIEQKRNVNLLRESYIKNLPIIREHFLNDLIDHSQEMQGYQTLWNLLNRITGRFRANTVLDAFYCEKRMRAVIQDEDTYPYFFGGIEMEWNLPEMEEDEVI